MSHPTLKELLKPNTDTVSSLLLEELGIKGDEYQHRKLCETMPPPHGQDWLQSPDRTRWFKARVPEQVRLAQVCEELERERRLLARRLDCRLNITEMLTMIDHLRLEAGEKISAEPAQE